MLDLNFLSLPLLTASMLIFVSILIGAFSKRAGFSFLLAFLVTGLLAGVDGPVGLEFNDYRLSFWVGNLALAIILLDGGLRTDFGTFRTGLRPALGLATLGVVLTAGLTALAAMLFLGLGWASALLLGAVVGSTDAAAVFALLKSAGVQLNERVATTLEIESGMNDPMAVFLTMTLIGVAAALTAGQMPEWHWQGFAKSLLQQFGLGAMMGVASGWAMAKLLRRSRMLADAGGGVLALLLATGGLMVFAKTTLIGGSGFLAIYLMGVVVNHRAPEAVHSSLSALDGYAWLSQALMFVLLGLLATPSQMLGDLLPSLGVAAALMFVARPLAVWLCLAPMRFTRKEVAYIGWVGLRGAVPIVLAIFPFMAGLPDAPTIFNVAFIVVLASLLLQGSTIGWLARKTGVALPDESNVEAMRVVYGDFTLPAQTPLVDVCSFYGLSAPPSQTRLTLEGWLADAIRRPLVVGDHAMLDGAEICVRSMEGSRVKTVGLKLPDPAQGSAPDGP